MDLKDNWQMIRSLLNNSTNVVIASTNADGSPHVTPIGSLRLGEVGKGYFVEKFTRRLPENLDRDGRISIFATNLSTPGFFVGMLRGRFDRLPSLRLTGKVGPRRELTDSELDAFRKKVRIFRWTPGYALLWGQLKYARDVEITGVYPVYAGDMTKHLRRARSFA